jgi:hypothetical protein
MVVTVTLPVEAVAIRLAGSSAVSCVALTYVVFSAAASQYAIAVEVKFAPSMVSVRAAPPATASGGLRLVMTGGSRLTSALAGRVETVERSAPMRVSEEDAGIKTNVRAAGRMTVKPRIKK